MKEFLLRVVDAALLLVSFVLTSCVCVPGRKFYANMHVCLSVNYLTYSLKKYEQNFEKRKVGNMNKSNTVYVAADFNTGWREKKRERLKSLN